jgi:hypothetical protein
MSLRLGYFITDYCYDITIEITSPSNFKTPSFTVH